MEFRWTDEQRELRASVRGFLQDRAPIGAARALAEAGGRHDPAVWTRLAQELGLTALAVPEDHGGLGASRVETAVVAEEMGRVLFGGPYLSTAVLAVEALLATDDPAVAAVLGDIAEGASTVALAVAEEDGRWQSDAVATTVTDTPDGPVLDGRKTLVLDGADADRLLVVAHDGQYGGPTLVLVQPDADGLTRQPQQVLDATRPLASLVLDRTPGRRLGAPGVAGRVIDRARQAGLIFLAAEQAGAAARALEITAEYARTRRQFGRVIGTFQGVKHRLATMAVQVELARSAAYWAAWQEPGSPAAEVATAVAARHNAAAAEQVALDMIQLHGGIGFTWEHDAHLFLRRARASSRLCGTPEDLRPALEAALLQEVSA